MEDNKIKRDMIIIIIFLFIIILCVLFFIINYKSRVEQYYIDEGGFITQHEKRSNDITSFAFSTFKDGEIINSYDEYMEKIKDKNKGLNVLDNVVNEDFFNEHSLLIVESSVYSPYRDSLYHPH